MLEGSAVSSASAGESSTDAWRELRADEDIQFSEVTIPELPPREPTWLDNVFLWLAELFKPIGQMLAASWPILKWVLLAMAIAAAIYLLLNLIDPELFKQRKKTSIDEAEQDWRPNQSESEALLQDADRLAAEGKYDEATHLLLQRSVGQIARARPDLVEPSSTARELATLKSLPDQARAAFSAISERVERSLFALRHLDQSDWEAARAAYAEFAQIQIDRVPT